MFRDRFWLSVVLTIPTVVWGHMLSRVTGFTAPTFVGSTWIAPVFGTTVFAYGGLVFLKGGLGFLSGNEASGNNGPGFVIRSIACCMPNEFDTAAAFSNAGPGIVYIGRDDGTNCVGGTGADCSGGTFFPAGFDTTPGGISASGNSGECPPESLPSSLGPEVCPVVWGPPCGTLVLDRCLF